jgi:hypothetical protein
MGSQLANTAPLLLACDFGIRIDDLLINGDKYVEYKTELDPEDVELLGEKVPEK